MPASAPLGGSRAAHHPPIGAPMRPDRSPSGPPQPMSPTARPAISPPSPRHRPAPTGSGTPGTHPAHPRSVPAPPAAARTHSRAYASRILDLGFGVGTWNRKMGWGLLGHGTRGRRRAIRESRPPRRAGRSPRRARATGLGRGVSFAADRRAVSDRRQPGNQAARRRGRAKHGAGTRRMFSPPEDSMSGAPPWFYPQIVFCSRGGSWRWQWRMAAWMSRSR